MLDHVLRVLQLIFATIVMETDGYDALLSLITSLSYSCVSRPHCLRTLRLGSFYDYYGVPNSWGFLILCAGWTFLTVIFHTIARIKFPDGALIGYIHVAVETVAVLSWLAGFIAVAVQISTGTCSTGKNSCRILIVATIFGALEWLLFMITAALTAILIFKQVPKPKTSTTGPDTAI
ncbi:hypothetical protein BCON_0218g00020 [Botryotinia convoluta]|uniref:MARVEL domain-containing protein n=1 Tax=Botryotinia convoluta TaxID=54673 RepID=A0A4Z1HKK7_9HELO|nr:hypothetical protein BCON_0218g00020 [Botryotinia convoluta]